jgi:hypothetical protein
VAWSGCFTLAVSPVGARMAVVNINNGSWLDVCRTLDWPHSEFIVYMSVALDLT